MVFSFLNKNKRLGIANKPRRYDLPLDDDSGAGFLVLLTALMTFLAVVAMGGSMVLGSLTNKWSSGLENKMTIEIPVEKENGDLRTQEDITALSRTVKNALEKNETIINIDILTQDDTHKLIEPWLGEDLPHDLPLPGLIALDVHDSTSGTVANIRKTLREISLDIKLDTHEEWLATLLRLIGSLRFSAIMITLVIGTITVVAITGAMRARMDIHRDDVELLHLMGAQDKYIARQFQRHARILTLKGGVIGLCLSGILFILFKLITGQTEATGIPQDTLNFSNMIWLIILPFALSAIATISARYTVLRTLSRMP